jgi:hypothetical protein
MCDKRSEREANQPEDGGLRPEPTCKGSILEPTDDEEDSSSGERTR